MIVKEYEDAGLFLKDYEVYMMKKEAVSQLLLYPAYQSLPTAEPGKELYGAVLEEQEPVLLFCNKPGYKLVFLSLRQENSVAATTALADFFGCNHVSIAGISARQELCQSFIDQYSKYISGSFLQKQESDIMELIKVNELKPVSGVQRLATPSEVKLVTDWLLRFQMETLMSELDYEAALIMATKLIEEEKLYLYENEDQTVVSMAAIYKKLLRGIMITYIYTPEEYRGNGYAAVNVYYLSKMLLSQGYEFCALLADKKNPLSIRAYEKVGYEILEDICEYMMIVP